MSSPGSLTMTEIVFELVAVIFHHAEASVLDLPARSAPGDDFGDILSYNGKARYPCHGNILRGPRNTIKCEILSSQALALGWREITL
jgi:hypothetical protein